MNIGTESKDSESKNKIYNCTKCGYSTMYNSHWIRHLESNKHKGLKKAKSSKPKVACQYRCMCGKKYKHHSSYYRHLNTCKSKNNLNVDEILDKLQKSEQQNEEMKNVLIQIKELVPVFEHIRGKEEWEKINSEIRETFQWYEPGEPGKPVIL